MMKILLKIQKTYFKLKHYLLLIAVEILLTGVITFILSNLLFIISIKINPFVLPIGVAISILLTYFLTKEYFFSMKWYFSRINFLVISFVTIIIFFLSISVSSYFYDVSCDGQEYHQEIIFSLVDEEWNPLRQYNPPNNTYDGLDTWVQHYAKGSETISASIYSLTNQIESGKAFNLLLIIASFILVYLLLNQKFKISKVNSFLLSTAIAFNPVTISQSLSYYIDGEISSLIIITLALGVFFVIESKKIFLIPFLSGILLLISFKFTSILYAIIICGAIILFLFILKKNIKSIFKLSLIMLFTGLVSIIMLNFNPYVYNTLQFGHPFHPLAGKNSINFMDENTPVEYNNLNKIEKIAAASFILDTNYESVRPRIPFNLESWDFQLLKYTDIRVEGFGPFFMEITIISMILTILLLINRNISLKNKIFLIISFSILLFSVILIPESWWARYVPQLYLINIFSLILLYSSSLRKKSFVGNLLLFFLILNSLYMGGIYLKGSIDHTLKIKNSLEELKNEKREIYIFKDIGFHNNMRRLEEKNIPFKIVETYEEWKELEHSGWIFPESTFEIGFKN